MYINDKTHISVIIKSLNNIYNQSKIYGKLNVEDINYLNIIYKLLNTCYLDLSVDEINTLSNLYENIQFHSKHVCPVLKYPKHIQTKPTFVQAETNDCNNNPITDRIFYWEDRRFLDTDYNLTIATQASNTTFLFAQDSETYDFFNAGYEWPLESGDTRVMCINIYDIPQTNQYKLYNEFEQDVTNSFYYHYITQTNSILYIGKIDVNALEYIKIKKIENTQPQSIFNNTFNNIFI
jgi:hypothetical protein